MALTAIFFIVAVVAANLMGTALGMIADRHFPNDARKFDTDDLQLAADIFAVLLFASILGFIGAVMWK